MTCTEYVIKTDTFYDMQGICDKDNTCNKEAKLNIYLCGYKFDYTEKERKA